MRILDANILGSSCSRVCPVDVLCEGACVMHRQNHKPIQIALLQRHAMDAFHHSVSRFRLLLHGRVSFVLAALAAARHRSHAQRNYAGREHRPPSLNDGHCREA